MYNYIIHNVIQTRDLMAVQDQISQGVDKKPTKILIDKIRAFDSGQCLVYRPDLVPKMIGQANVHNVLTKTRGNRSTTHAGDNVKIEIKGGKVWHSEPTKERTIAGMKNSLLTPTRYLILTENPKLIRLLKQVSRYSAIMAERI